MRKPSPARRDDHADVMAPRRRERRPLVGALAGDGRVENAPDPDAVENSRGPSDVVALRMREDDHGQAPYAEAAKLRRDICLRRPLVDEHRAFGHLEQRAVSLADVEEGDPQPFRRRQGVGAASQPPAAARRAR